jgi:hypothetical protein
MSFHIMRPEDHATMSADADMVIAIAERDGSD